MPRALIACIMALCTLLLITPHASAQGDVPPTIDLAEREEVGDLFAQMSYLFGDTVQDDDGLFSNGPIDDALSLVGTDSEFSATEAFDKGDPATRDLTDSSYIYGPVWARLKFANLGEESKRWRIDFRAPDTYPLRAWLIREDGTKTVILDNDWEVDKPRERDPAMFLVASRAFTVSPGEQLEVWFDVPHGWSSAWYLRIVDENRFVADRQRDSRVQFTLYGMRVAILLGMLAFALVLRDRPAFYYCGFHSGLLLAVLFEVSFNWEWAGLAMSQTAPIMRIFYGLALMFYGLTLYSFLDAKRRYPRFARILKISLGIGFASIPLLSILDLIPAFGFYIGMLEAVVWLQFALMAGYGNFLGVRDGLPGARLFLFATLALIGLGIVQLLFAYEVVMLSQWRRIELNSVVFTVDALIFAAALVQRAVKLRGQRDAALNDKMRALVDKAEMREELSEAQKDYKEALALAEERRHELAATTHDLKQPLLSLQLALSKLKGAEGASEGVSYIESLVNRSLVDTNPARAKGQATQDGFLLDNALRNVTLMFRDEAAAKGVKLSYVTTSAVVDAEPIALMRIITNLVANAINHAGASRILVGVRRMGDGVDIAVVDDGQGIAEDKLDTVFDAYAAGEGSPGSGLGLTVVRDMALQRGWHVHVESRPGSGTTFRLGTLPLA